jgi:hypothetical protein
MASISIPTGIKIRASNFGLITNTRIFQSPFTGATQTLRQTGERWKATYTLSTGKRATMAEVQAFLIKLKGMSNTFKAYDPDAKTARGTPTGTPLVKGGSQTGTSLLIDGCTNSVTGWLKAGDYFVVNGELKMITADVNSNGSGECTLVFEPALRVSPADNAPITISNCTCEMMLIDDNQSQWDSDAFGNYSITFSGVERLT